MCSCHGNLEYRAKLYVDGDGNAVDNRNPVQEPVSSAPSPARPTRSSTTKGKRFRTPRLLTSTAVRNSASWSLDAEQVHGSRWHYVPQTYDTVANDVGAGHWRRRGSSRATSQPIYSLNASIFHGRYNDTI